MDDLPAISRDHRLLRVLGRGGMGVVYEAEHIGLGRRVALKVLSEERSDDATALARLRREALSMGALQHPHVVQVSGFNEGPPPFLEMELLAGQSLRDRLVQRGAMRPADACSVALQLLSALGAAHRAGIVHRDVKPGNVFIVDTPLTNVFVKLLDFGVAKLLTPQQGPALTSFDAVVGSAPYMAPEQIRGDAIDGRTDVFGLGVTLYEMLAGRRPFVAAPNENVMATILRGGPIAPLVGVPGPLETAVLRALTPSPSARYASVEEMTEALLPFVSREQLDALATTAVAIHTPASLTSVGTRTAEAALWGPSTIARTIDQTGGLSSHGPSPMAPTAPLPPWSSQPRPSFVHPPPIAVAPRPRSLAPFLVGGGAMLALVLFVVGLGVLAWTSGVTPDSVTPTPAPTPAPISTATIGPIIGSCRMSGVCFETTKFFTAKDAQSKCTKGQGTWRDGPCDRRGSFGGCRIANGGLNMWYFPPSEKNKTEDCPSDGVPVLP